MRQSKNFNIEDCLEISRRVGAPVVLDNHHFFCYQIHSETKLKYDIATYVPIVLDTWKAKGIRPKFHISEQGCGKTGHHSDFISSLPDYYLEIPEKYDIGVDIMVEAKQKEQAIFKLYNTHRELFGEFIKTITFC
jgi:UV DNA damage endonuclease